MTNDRFATGDRILAKNCFSAASVSNEIHQQLMSDPQSVDVDSVNWAAIDPRTWTDLLIRHPQLADKCDRKVWNKFSACNWVVLLSEAPQFADKCNWRKFDKDNWLELLLNHPQFADKCNKWSEFSIADWRDLLCNHPQFADKFDKWYEFSGDDWSKLDMFDWCLLYVKQPELVKKHCRSKIKLWKIKFRTALSSDLKKISDNAKTV